MTRFYTLHIYLVCNYQVVIDHTFMPISLNLADFKDFFLLETLTSVPLLLHSLLIEECARLENYLEFSRFFACG